MMKRIQSLFAAALMLVSAASHAVLIDVFAQQNSTTGGAGANTGLVLNAGDAFSIQVDSGDLWSAGALPRWSNADGLVGDLFASGSDESGQAAGTKIGAAFPLHAQHGLSLPFGSLVGSIDGNFFLVGTNFFGNAIASGTLLLWYWDSNSGDNSEKITADVRARNVNAVPEPSLVLLMLVGLVGLGFHRVSRRG